MDPISPKEQFCLGEVGLKQNEYFQVPGHTEPTDSHKQFKAASVQRSSLTEPRLGYMLIRTFGLLPLIILVCVACSS